MNTYEKLIDLIERESADDTNVLSPEFVAFRREFEPLAAPNIVGETLDWDERLPEDIRSAFSTIQRRMGFASRHGDHDGKSRRAIEAAARILADRYDTLKDSRKG